MEPRWSNGSSRCGRGLSTISLFLLLLPLFATITAALPAGDNMLPIIELTSDEGDEPIYLAVKRAHPMPFSGGMYGKRGAIPFSGGMYGKRAAMPFGGGMYGKRAAPMPFSGGMYGKRGDRMLRSTLSGGMYGR